MTASPVNPSLVENKLPKHLRAWTLEEIRLMRELLERGLTAAAIAVRLKRTVHAVRKRAWLHGIALPER